MSVWAFVINPLIRSKKFETTTWINNPSSRYKMVNDLKNNDLLIGKTKQEVLDFLGNDYKENCYKKNTICYIAYDPDNYAVLDHFEFVIYFDNNGIVVKVSSELI